MRAYGTPLFRNPITTNPFVWGALLLCTGLLLIGTCLLGLSSILDMVVPGPEGWILILGLSLLPLMIGQILKLGFKAVNSQKKNSGCYHPSIA